MKLNKLYRSILWRSKTYDDVMVSRHEHEEYKISEWQMRLVIRDLRRNWLLKVWTAPSGYPRPSNLYKATKELIAYLKEKLGIVRKSFDIVEFNSTLTTEEIKNLFGLRWTKKNYVIWKDKEKECKYTLNMETRVVAKWFNWWYKHFNLFNWLKEIYWFSTKDLINNL